MGRLAENQYRLDVSKAQMKKIGFRYDRSVDDYTYTFPVYRYKEIPLVFCKLGTDDETKNVWFKVCDINDVAYAPYYDRRYGINTMIPEIESIISDEFDRIGVVKVD